jgi:two-component system phosphate regulon sensor histidine kinase PhoR
MTHEFKTPIATISIASEMLLKPDVNEFPYKTKRYANVIFDENTRLQKQVEQILQLSVLERGDFKLKLKEIDIHRLIRQQVKHFTINIQKRGGMITTELKAEDHHLMLDATHISNIISNLIDNAVKYSSERPEVIVKTHIKHGKIIISIADNGIGISPENQKYIFNKLYRVPTGNLHDVKGFGLGLYYVRTMVEALDGEIKLISETNKGSTFILEFPLNNKPKTK